ncbi:phosphatase PAP2 family protein [Adlercreutzia sp. ZJ138]|uniref:phosphatase PAP2 family protein n=1 Tax=Adlercreutzia sp. ZJ138 TaxID=2709405 RepID=UPI001F14BB04|nr:phosphatase PAP2 family protein [Adlercreutzia sp. ZJ138]
MSNTTSKRNVGGKELIAGLGLLVTFTLWTALIQCVDIRPVGQNGTDVGFATFNVWFHGLTGVHMGVYLITDWLGLVPIAICACFGALGAAQLVRRRSLLQVDTDLLLLGAYYLFVIFGYLIFEMIPINYRPVPIDGMMEASYPSSTTLLVLSVMPTLKYQVDRRAKSPVLRSATTAFVAAFSVLMVLGRLVSGVHWATDIVGAALLAAGLFVMYLSAVTFANHRGTKPDTEGRGWSFARSCRN